MARVMKVMEERHCVNCDRTYLSSKSTQRFCSPQCSAAAFHKAHQDPIQKANAKWLGLSGGKNGIVGGVK